MNGANTQKPATAARMYDYFLGGIHNFPADREAAKIVMAQFPSVPAIARANRAFVRRAVRHLADAGVRQFLDVGSGIPTVDNVHDIARRDAPEARVVYVDIDPDAVAESLEILEADEHTTAIRADLRNPEEILAHPGVRQLLAFDQPIGLLLAAVLHFVPDDTQAYDVVARLVSAVAPHSYLVVSHAAAEGTFGRADHEGEPAEDVYRQRTSTPGVVRTRSGIERFFAGVEVLDPGVVWLPEWRPDRTDPDHPVEFADDPQRSAEWVGVGRKK